MGSARPNIVPDQVFACSDGYVAVSVPHNGFWPKLCNALGLGKLRDDPRFATNSARVELRAELLPILEACFREHSAEEWERRLHDADVPAAACQRGPTLSASLLEHPQAIAEDLVTVLDTPYGAMASAKPHWRFSKTEARIARAAPRSANTPRRCSRTSTARAARERPLAPTATGGRTHGCPSKACASSMSRRGSPARSARCSSATSVRRW